MNTATLPKKMMKPAHRAQVTPKRKKVVVEAVEVIQLDEDGQRLAAQLSAALRKLC